MINPDHLLDQAEALALPVGAGARRQTDYRRAISSSYYGLFHAILTKAADEAVGVGMRTDPVWTLAYRSVTHRWLKEFCWEISKPTMPARFRPYVPDAGWGTHVETIAGSVVELQASRHAADYNPMEQVIKSDALAAIKTARSAIRRLSKLRTDRRKAFLFLVLFQPR